MTKTKLRHIFTAAIAIYVLFVVLFYFLAQQQLMFKQSSSNIQMPEGEVVSDEIKGNRHITQYFRNGTYSIEEISIMFIQYYREDNSNIVVELLDSEELLMRKKISTDNITDQKVIDIVLENPITGVNGRQLLLDVYAENGEDTGTAIMMNQSSPVNGWTVRMGGRFINDRMCFSLSGLDQSLADDHYWYIMIALGVLLILLLIKSYHDYCNNYRNYIVAAILAVYNYEFLISQLVIRDFKSKYKRSILGVFWSFLNPLLTMTVQFLVFSTFFMADTQNYPVYLLSGVVCFSFFSECTTMCLSSISGNARLITKVYIPKYIFPLSRTISSSINLGISLIPLLLACLVLGVAIRPQALLFFFFLICLIVFSLGIGLFLSALMVYFRDIQFLWTVITQVWMYATPIFYPAEIVPDKYRFILRINPLYHFIGNARTCLINGVSPEPKAYLFCLFFAALSLAIGSYTFKKTQDNFALYL